MIEKIIKLSDNALPTIEFKYYTKINYIGFNHCIITRHMYNENKEFFLIPPVSDDEYNVIKHALLWDRPTADELLLFKRNDGYFFICTIEIIK